MQKGLSAVVLTKNEEKNIIDCIESVNFCDEIIIIDDYSTDGTKSEIQKLKSKNQNYNSKIKIYERKLNADFATQRNYGLKQAKGEWVLFVDADERASEELKKEILRLVSLAQDDKKSDAYYIKRRDFWWGRELRYGEVGRARNQGIVRLVKKDSGVFMGNVHEIFHTANATGTLDGYLDHYPHPTVKDFLNKINDYSSIRAHELYNKGKSTNWLEICLLPGGKFILNYFLYLGFLDGAAGFAYCFMMSFHSFLVRAKLYQLNHNVH